MDEAYLEKRRLFEAAFEKAILLPEHEKIHESNCGQYRLTTNNYTPGPDGAGGTHAVVTRISNNKILAEVKRNHCHFWHLFATHPNGNDYFLCGEDYQGYSVYNLTTGRHVVHFPARGHQGFGFCWTSATPSPDGLMLAVDGCFWAAPYEIVFYDFRVPDVVPLPELGRVSHVEKVIGWKDNQTYVLIREVHYRVCDGKPYENLTDAEQDEIDDNDALGAYRHEQVEVPRPDVTDM